MRQVLRDDELDYRPRINFQSITLYVLTILDEIAIPWSLNFDDLPKV